MANPKSNSENINIGQENVLEKIFQKKSIVNKYLKINDEPLEELESLKYDDGNLKEFFEKYFECKSNQKLLVEKMNDFREFIKKIRYHCASA